MLPESVSTVVGRDDFRFLHRTRCSAGCLDLQVSRLGHADNPLQSVEFRVLLEVQLEMLELPRPELLQVAVILGALRTDFERPAFVVRNQDPMVGRFLVFEQPLQGGRCREADVGHEQDARAHLPSIGFPAFANPQVVGRQSPRLFLQPLEASEGVRQAVAGTMSQQRADQTGQVARVGREAPALQPVLADLFLDLAIDDSVDGGLELLLSDFCMRVTVTLGSTVVRPLLDPCSTPH